MGLYTLSQLQHPHLTFSPTEPRMLEDGLVVPETYTALCTSRRQLETLEEQLRKKTLTLKHMKLEIGSIKKQHCELLLNSPVGVFFLWHQRIKRGA